MCFSLVDMIIHQGLYLAWPLMFKSANVIHALPSVDEHPSWLPVDFAGRGIVEIVLRPEHRDGTIYHIVNPDTTTSWDELLTALQSAGLGFEKVSLDEWLERLSKSEQDPAKNPTIKLLVSFAILQWQRY